MYREDSSKERIAEHCVQQLTGREGEALPQVWAPITFLIHTLLLRSQIIVLVIVRVGRALDLWQGMLFQLLDHDLDGFV